MEVAWYVYKYFLSFHDLTVPAMLLSKTVCTPYISKYLPNFLDRCKQCLHDNLQKYYSSKYQMKLVGVPAINEAVYLKVSVDSRYTKLKSILLYQIAGIRHPEELNWEDAKNFLKNRIIPREITVGKNSSHLWEDIFHELDCVDHKDYDAVTKSLVSNLDEDEKKCLCLLIYSQSINYSISCLESHTIECLVPHPACIKTGTFVGLSCNFSFYGAVTVLILIGWSTSPRFHRCVQAL